MAYIKEYINAIPETLCKEIISKFEVDTDKHTGKCGDRVNLLHKKTTDLMVTQEKIENDEQWANIETKITDKIGKYLEKYIFEHIAGEIFNKKGKDDCREITKILGLEFKGGLRMNGYKIQKYVPGGYFHPHSDDTPYTKRLIAVLIYLNDVNSEDGGSTRFYNGRDIKPEIGKIVFFPSTWSYVHEGTELKRGVKYVISNFVESAYDTSKDNLPKVS
mgnify:FL=1